MNSTAGLDASCVAAAAQRGDTPGAACTLPEDVAPHISVPVFTMNSKYDPALISISTAVKTPAAVNGEHFLLLCDACRSSLRSDKFGFVLLPDLCSLLYWLWCARVRGPIRGQG